MPTPPLHRFRPRLLDALKGYDRQRLGSDIGAGITVGVVALPLAMAFAIASGVKPEQGLVTAIIAGLLISLLGGSSVQIGTQAMLLDIHRLVLIDTSGIDALHPLWRQLQRQNVGVVLARVNEQPLSLMRRSGFEAVIGSEHIAISLDAALVGAAAHAAATQNRA